MDANLVQLFTAHSWTGYVVLFVVIFFEGPVATAFGGFAAAMGLIDPWIVMLLSILGNFIPDIILYVAGYKGVRLIGKYGQRFGITAERMNAMGKLYENHSFSTLLVVKIIPTMAVPGLIAAGAVRMPLGKYSLMSFVIILLTSGLYLAIGYYSGAAYEKFAQHQVAMLTLAGVAIAVVVYTYNRFMSKVGKWIFSRFQQ